MYADDAYGVEHFRTQRNGKSVRTGSTRQDYTLFLD